MGTPRLFTRLPLAVAIGLLLLWGGASYLLPGRVVSVIDGDSLVVQVSPVRRQEVRLYGIDCPEGRQKGGEAAAERTRELTLLRTVSLEVMDTDRYGRAVAVVSLPDGTVLNEILLREGRAWFYDAHCRDARCAAWKKLAAAARNEGRGLWADTSPVPPWKWRQRQNKGRNAPERR